MEHAKKIKKLPDFFSKLSSTLGTLNNLRFGARDIDERKYTDKQLGDSYAKSLLYAIRNLHVYDMYMQNKDNRLLKHMQDMAVDANACTYTFEEDTGKFEMDCLYPIGLEIKTNFNLHLTGMNETLGNALKRVQLGETHQIMEGVAEEREVHADDAVHAQLIGNLLKAAFCYHAMRGLRNDEKNPIVTVIDNTVSVNEAALQKLIKLEPMLDAASPPIGLT